MSSVNAHGTPSDPNSGNLSFLGGVELATSLSELGLSEAGFVGIAGWAKSAIPALIFFVAIQRYLIAGWGAGGMKG